jgi:hypothetical protein
MRAVVLVGVLALGLATSAFAQCPCSNASTRVTKLSALFSGKTVCASRGDEQWQEYHAAGGALIDYKRGPSDRTDPTTQVGNWSVSGDTLTHNYGPGASYQWAVCGDTPKGPYRFCDGASSVVSGATLRDGQVACGGLLTRVAPIAAAPGNSRK